ncbi:hypothetical protein MSSD14B_41300 [Marinobacter salsuginis]|uniref:Uncharacterized protein n=1 Tax=Marinobacter salsuginis TaxID=418719 RepID=A0A5M3Q5G9_9GAMM|nr:hypothetical protein MSSD14B_41300 [Marinobacter salsuginis]
MIISSPIHGILIAHVSSGPMAKKWHGVYPKRALKLASTKQAAIDLDNEYLSEIDKYQ